MSASCVGRMLLDRCAARSHHPARSAFAVLMLVVAGPSMARAYSDNPPPDGRTIYGQLCARCHGHDGQGVADEGTEPFAGSQTLADLVRVIDETMPEDDPTLCEGDAARSVAQYVYDTFLAAEAEARDTGARIELSRLTVRQYDNTLADLFGTFLGQGKSGDERGLSARYFNSKDFNREKLVTERVDPHVQFNFSEQSPEEGKIGAEEFAIQWQGGLIAEETGDYEFCVTTENGMKLWVNDPRQPLIDAWVASGGTQQHRATVRLLGGRVYPIRLQFFKFKIPTASIQLAWTPPHRAEEIIPPRNLTPDWCPPVYVNTIPFPPDDSSMGYERGTAVSKAWEQAVTSAAIDAANQVVDQLNGLAKTKPDAEDRRQRVEQFCQQFAERALRRPLSDEQRAFYVGQFFQENVPLEQAAKISALLVLQSPRFLYVVLNNEQLDDYDVAARLAFALWDSLPDQPLLEAAKAGRLQSRDEVAAQARRMLGDARTKAKMRYFLHHWLNIEHLESLAKDQERYAEFDAAVASDLRVSLDLMLDDIIWNDTSDFRQLLLADYWFVNQRLAGYYDLQLESGDEWPAQFHKVACDSQQRAGILTHPYLLARFAYHKSSSPIHRGVFMIRSLLGRFLKPPPIAVAPLDEGVDPTLTTRQRVERQTREPTCQTCHGLINSLGFALEHYDAVGKYRALENEQPVDASGSYLDLQQTLTQFNGARQLAEFLAASEETHACFVKQLFHSMAKQPLMAYGPETVSGLQKSFAESGFNMQELLVEIATTSALGTNKE